MTADLHSYFNRCRTLPARRLTQMYGIGGTEVAIAWDAVEEMVTARCRQLEDSDFSFEQYCALHPDAPECRLYDV